MQTISDYYKTVWTDFTVKDHMAYMSEILLSTLHASDKAILVGLNFSKYSGYNGTGYGEGSADRGITEQEAYNIWINSFETQQRVFRQQLKALDILQISQSVYDGLFLYYWATGKILEVSAAEGTYELRNLIIKKDWDTVSSMIMRSKINKKLCRIAATVLRLADYGKPKDRKWLRANGVYEMRSKNEIGAFSQAELLRVRFAYYAETLDFLPRIPDAKKPEIVREYNKTLITKQYRYDGTTKVFTLLKSPSMYPIEKLQVKINGNIVQQYYDFTVSGNELVITDSAVLNLNDAIDTQIKI